MPAHQRFRLGDIIESLAIRTDVNGQLYSHMPDIQDLFPQATAALRFKVDGVNLFFLEDENGQRYEPKRIAHYPDDIIDIVPAVSTLVPASPPFSSTDKTERIQSQLTKLTPTSNIEYAVSTISLQAVPTTTSYSSTRDLVRLPAFAKTMTAFNPILASLVATLASNASGISDLQQQVTQLDNTGSAQHLQLMEWIAQMMQHQNELLEKQNTMLQEQADAKDREEKMMAELEAAKERDREILRMQQQTIDRLIIAQQRVDAILVQNYELHEYPIPRLFVILPDSYERWDPRNFLKERFRLYFLCECGENCEQDSNEGATSGQVTITAAEPPVAPIRVKNRIHLAKHDGYELSRPTEFFNRYGPYVLGMLKILKHCLTVATIVSPAATLAENGVKDVMDGVKSISESTMRAVDMSISFLEQKLDDSGASDDLVGAEMNAQDTDNMFESLAALEGSDLRRLDTFLRNNDQNRIMGNLYRISTEQGHVKWVCFEHYQEKYRATALASFIQSVKAASGTYDPHFLKVTIRLTSSTTAKDFFRRLVTQAPAVEGLDVTLDWDFGSADLVNLVDMVAKSNVKSITLDLQVDHTSNSTIAALRPGKGRYHSLMSLFSNRNIRRLQFSNLHLLGTRTSNITPNLVASWIQSFHFEGQVNDEGKGRLANILSHCPGLVDLCLSNSRYERNEMDLNLRSEICGLKKLRRLHVTGWDGKWSNQSEEQAWEEPMPLRGLVYAMRGPAKSFVEQIIQQSHEILEVLVLFDWFEDGTPIAVVPDSLLVDGSPTAESCFSRLTHLELPFYLSKATYTLFQSILPRLNLVHLGCSVFTSWLLEHINLISLKSLSIQEVPISNVMLLKQAIQGLGGNCQIESLNVFRVNSYIEDLSEILKMLQLKRLFLNEMSAASMVSVLQHINLSKLQILSLYRTGYSQYTRKILEQRIFDEHAEHFVVQLDIDSWDTYTGVNRSAVRIRPNIAAPVPFNHHIQTVKDYADHYYQFLQPILPDYTY